MPPSDDYTASLEERVMRLEERVAFQEHTIEELSTALTDQWKRIEHYHREIERLNAELEDIGEAAGEPGREPPPPHY